MCSWLDASPSFAHVLEGSRFVCILVVCTATFPTNYGQHFLYLFWTLLSRSLLSISGLGFVQKFLEVPNPYESFDFIFEGHAPLGTMLDVLVNGSFS